MGGAGHVNVEQEIKLMGPPSALARVADLPLIVDNALSPREVETARTRYVDTADGDLARAGVSMRLRAIPKGFFQTVKARAVKNGLVQQHLEIETILESESDFPADLPNNVPGDLEDLIATHRASLIDTVGNLLTGWSRQVRWRDSTLEVCVDEGDVIFNDPATGKRLIAPFAQAEVELVEGDPRALREFTRRLVATAGLRLSTLGKETAAHYLPRALPPPSSRAPKTQLDPEGTASEAMKAALGSSLAQIVSNIDAAAAGNDDGIKRVRVGLRRFRATERVFRRGSNWKAGRQLIREAKRYGKILGVARDWDVFVDETMAAMLASPVVDQADRRPLSALYHAAEARRLSARSLAVDTVSDPAFSEFCLALNEEIQAEAWREGQPSRLSVPGGPFAADVLDAALSKVRRVGQSLADAPAPARHPLRLELKKLRYALQAFRNLMPSETRKPYLRTLSRLQDGFGRLNDGVVARQLALEAASIGSDAHNGDTVDCGIGASFLIGWTTRAIEDDARTLRAAWADFESMAPPWQTLMKEDKRHA